MGRIPKRTAEEIAEARRQRQEFEQIYARMVARFKAADEREAARRARLRRLTFGLFAREPHAHTAK